MIAVLEQAAAALVILAAYIAILVVCIQRRWLRDLELYIVALTFLFIVTTLAVGRFM